MIKLDDRVLLLQLIYTLAENELHDILTFIQGYETCKQQLELSKGKI